MLLNERIIKELEGLDPKTRKALIIFIEEVERILKENEKMTDSGALKGAEPQTKKQDSNANNNSTE